MSSRWRHENLRQSYTSLIFDEQVAVEVAAAAAATTRRNKHLLLGAVTKRCRRSHSLILSLSLTHTMPTHRPRRYNANYQIAVIGRHPRARVCTKVEIKREYCFVYIERNASFLLVGCALLCLELCNCKVAIHAYGCV